MDTIIQKDRDEMEIIAKSKNDYPVLMINQNRYLKSEFPDGDLYSKWRTINKKMISEVNGKVIWTLKVEAPHLINGNLEPLDEILAYWYPSHSAFLKLPESLHYTENFRLREGLINYAIIHRCSEHTLPFDA